MNKGDWSTWQGLDTPKSSLKPPSSGVTLWNPDLVLADRKPVVHFLSLDDGTLLNRVPLEGAGTVRAGLTLWKGQALVATTEGKLFTADPERRSVTPVDVRAAQ